jgi:hypothetical protein
MNDKVGGTYYKHPASEGKRKHFYVFTLSKNLPGKWQARKYRRQGENTIKLVFVK